MKLDNSGSYVQACNITISTFITFDRIEVWGIYLCNSKYLIHVSFSKYWSPLASQTILRLRYLTPRAELVLMLFNFLPYSGYMFQEFINIDKYYISLQLASRINFCAEDRQKKYIALYSILL